MYTITPTRHLWLACYSIFNAIFSQFPTRFPIESPIRIHYKRNNPENYRDLLCIHEQIQLSISVYRNIFTELSIGIVFLDSDRSQLRGVPATFTPRLWSEFPPETSIEKINKRVIFLRFTSCFVFSLLCTLTTRRNRAQTGKLWRINGFLLFCC